MPLCRESQDALVEAVRDAAAAEIMPRFRQLETSEIATKASAFDLVTAADTGAEAHIRAAIKGILPDARVIGEEGVAADPSELDQIDAPGLTVIIDPVDGTWNFARGLATFGTLLAVVEDGQAIFGLLYDPVIDDWIEATKGAGAWHIARGARRQLVLPPALPLAEMTGLHARYGLTKAQWVASAGVHMSFAKVTSIGASLWDYRMLTTAGVGFCLNRYLNVWDHAAGVLALTEAGGYAALLDGTPYRPGLREGYLLAAQSKEVWEAVAGLFRPAIHGA